MKFIVLLTVISLHVAAAVRGQQITLSVKNASLTEVLRSIRLQSGYNFIAQAADLDKASPVTISLNNTPIEKTLQAIFADQPLDWKLDGKFILVTPKSNKTLTENFLVISISGKVTDDQGNPLHGATVKAGGKSTATHSKGEFTLDGLEEGAIVEVSFLGYKTQTAKAISGFMSFMLEPTAAILRTVEINKGYYTTTNELNTGSVPVITARDLSKNPVGDPLQALQGRAAGLYLAQNNGVSGSASSIKLRGQNSLRSGVNNPLFVVDGIPYESTILTNSIYGGATGGNLSPFSSIQLNDIESVSVLKDADATAIYGSRGANGVILIATKKAKVGRTSVNVNVYHGVSDVARRVDLLNTQEYLSMRRKALANDGVAEPSATDYDLNGTWGDINRYTDWQKIMIGGTAHVTDAQASVSGGNAQTQILFGGEYRKQTTVYPGDYQDEKASGHMSINHRSTDSKFKSTLTASYMRDKNTVPMTDFTRSIGYAPNAPALYNPDGSLNWQNSTWTNPLSTIYQTTTINTTNLITGVNLSYEIIPNLTASVRGGYNSFLINTSQLIPLKNSDPALPQIPALRTNQFSNSDRKTSILEPTLNYKGLFKFGNLDATVGATWQTQDFSALRQRATGFSSDALIKNIAAATNLALQSAILSKYRYGAIYARIGYNYQNQYLLNLTGRRDASSRFGPGNQFGNFGAVGAAWIFSKQLAVARGIPFVSFGKIRGSYGITGNDQIPDYQYLSTYVANSTTYQGASVLNPNVLGNNKFKWETVKKLDLGIDLAFFKDRIQIGATFYRNRTSNQLVGLDLSDVAGLPSIQANLPALLQNTGMELELTTTNISNKNFSWTTSANLTIPKDKLIRFDNFASSSYTTRYRVGEPLSMKLGYQYTGLDPATKVYTFADLNKDNNFTRDDYVARFFGQRFFGGINNNFSYKGLQLDIFFQYVNQVGGMYASSGVPPGYFIESISNIIKSNSTDFNPAVENYTQDGNSAAYQAFQGRYLSSDAMFVNTSFIRLKNLALSWSLPTRYLKVAKLQNARIYLQGQNLLTITKYKGLDPEVSSGIGNSNISLPPLRMFTAGIQLSL